MKKLNFYSGNYVACRRHYAAVLGHKSLGFENELYIIDMERDGTAQQKDISDFAYKLMSEIEVESYIFSNNDHFFNGIRLAIKDGKISPDQVRFKYCQLEEDGKPTCATITANKDGRIAHWPEGFFDNSENLLMKLL